MVPIGPEGPSGAVGAIGAYWAHPHRASGRRAVLRELADRARGALGRLAVWATAPAGQGPGGVRTASRAQGAGRSIWA